MDIQPISPAVPISKPVKVRQDEERKNKQNPGSKSEKQPPPQDDDIQHIDEVV